MFLCVGSARICWRLTASRPQQLSHGVFHVSRNLCRAPPASLFQPIKELATMALQKNPFTQNVVDAMRSLYPEELADRAWDNVGLLLENSAPGKGQQPSQPIVLLTNDVTPAVVDEAVDKKASVIVSYHPPIFRGMKSITLDDPQQRFLLKLVQHNIAVYSPHTALDGTPGGLNDWLADAVSDWTAQSGVTVTRAPLKPVSGPIPAGFEGAGYGRICTFSSPVPVRDILRALVSKLGLERHISVAAPRGSERQTRDERVKTLGGAATVSSVAVCAGSGADVMGGCDAGLLVTGEMSHHAALRATMLGQWVVTVFHSNSERSFLAGVLQRQLEAALKDRNVQGAKVIVSEADADPFEIWDVEELPK